MKTQEFLDLVAKALQRQPGTVTLNDTPDTLEEWDSIGHLAIIAILDSKLGIDPEAEELTDFTSIRELVDALKTKGTLQD